MSSEQDRELSISTHELSALIIDGAKRLDPITVICMNIRPGAGRIIIQCYDQAWAGYWGAMGSVTVEQFFMDCHPEYLAGNFRASKRDKSYLLRIVAAVQDGLRAAALAKGEGKV